MPPPFTTVAGAVFVTATSASGLTLRVALAATAFDPTLVLSAFTGMVFRCEAPAVEEVTSIESVHEPLAGIVPPVSVTLPAVLLGAPPQVVAGLATAAVVTPSGQATGIVSSMVARGAFCCPHVLGGAGRP